MTEEEERCGFCFQGSEEEVLKHFSCSHTFHDTCYSDWCRTRSSPIKRCMHCSRDISSELVQSYRWRYHCLEAMDFCSGWFAFANMMLIFVMLFHDGDFTLVGILRNLIITPGSSLMMKFYLPMLYFEKLTGITLIEIEATKPPEWVVPIVLCLMLSIALWWITTVSYYLLKLHAYKYQSRLVILGQ